MNKIALDQEVELDSYSLLTMTYTIDGYEELKGDISKNGLLVPIILRNGKLLDGRHRYKACKELGIEIDYIEVGNIDDHKALDIVISNSINKSTNTDAALVEAYLLCKAKGVKNKDMPNLFSRLNKNYINKLIYISKENPEYLQVLLRHNSVELYNKATKKLETYGTIHSLWKTLVSNNKLEDDIVEIEHRSVQDPEYDFDISEHLYSETAKGAYWDIYNNLKSQGIQMHPASMASRHIIDLVNYKYRVDSSKKD